MDTFDEETLRLGNGIRIMLNKSPMTQLEIVQWLEVNYEDLVHKEFLSFCSVLRSSSQLIRPRNVLVLNDGCKNEIDRATLDTMRHCFHDYHPRRDIVRKAVTEMIEKFT